MDRFDLVRSLVNQKFGEVRVLIEDNGVLFCGTDVARALGYAKPQNALSAHCPHALKRGVEVQTGVKSDGTPALQTIDMTFIPEGDVYRLIVRSKMESAEEFEHWLFDEMLPTLRSTGGYITDESLVVNTYFSNLDDGAKSAMAAIFKNLREQIEKNAQLKITNDCLVKETRTWDKRKVVVAMIRSLAARKYNNNYAAAYRDYYKELRYKKGICLSQRDGGNVMLDRVEDYEWDDLVQVATAMLEDNGIVVAEVVNGVNAELTKVG